MNSSKTLLRLASLILIFSLSGCGTRTIFIRPGTVCVTTESIRGAKIAVPDKDGKLVPSTGDIPKGALVQVPREDTRGE